MHKAFKMVGASAGAADNPEEVVGCAVREELAFKSGLPGTETDIISQSLVINHLCGKHVFDFVLCFVPLSN